MKYTIITGYWNGSVSWEPVDTEYKKDFFDIWYDNTLKYSSPQDIFVINPDSEIVPENKRGKWLDLSFNLGHAHDLDKNDYPHKKFGGWSMAFLTGALLCYSNDSDMIFKEQDCLAFGPWVDEMYKQMEEENLSMLFGRPEHADKQALEQSFFIIKRECLLKFVQEYIAYDRNDAGNGFVRTEGKFKHVAENHFKNKYGYLRFGYGRSRPENFDDEIFYMQKVKKGDIEEMRNKGLI